MEAYLVKFVYKAPGFLGAESACWNSDQLYHILVDILTSEGFLDN